MTIPDLENTELSVVDFTTEVVSLVQTRYAASDVFIGREWPDVHHVSTFTTDDARGVVQCRIYLTPVPHVRAMYRYGDRIGWVTRSTLQAALTHAETRLRRWGAPLLPPFDDE